MKEILGRGIVPIIVLAIDLLVLNFTDVPNEGTVLLHVGTFLVYCFYLLTFWVFKDNKYFGFVMVSFGMINIVLLAGVLVVYNQIAGDISKPFAWRFLAVSAFYFIAESVQSILHMQKLTRKAVKEQKARRQKPVEA